MKRKIKIALPILIVLILLSVVGWYLHARNIAVLNPAGTIANKERNLMFAALMLSVIVVVPVFTMAIVFAWKYRESNHRAHTKYSPDWDHSRLFEGLWWGIPIVIITVLSVITWNSSHALDPYKALASNVQPLTVQVVALDWKWLFIYPEQNIASVNLVEMPLNTPVNFQITSDTVMNSFWIPNLGSQIYAMPGMDTQLHLEGTKAGSYPGSSANISGSGFASMAFTAKVADLSDFNAWVQTVRHSHTALYNNSYIALSRPSQNNPTTYFASVDSNLFTNILNKYMAPMSNTMTGTSDNMMGM